MLDPKKYPVLSNLLTADADPDATYRIIRHYKDDHPNKTMDTGLSLKEAQAWCKDPETSSSKCKEKKNVEHTEKYGAWFDGYEEE
jgi:hypothetical protein